MLGWRSVCTGCRAAAPSPCNGLAVKDQFGPGHARMNNFKAVFRIALSQVACEYPAAKIELDGRGLTLRNSPPPVSKCMVLLEG